jgi:hypothetical protein
MFLTRFVRLSRFNARAWDYQRFFASARAMRVMLAGWAVVVALMAAILLWPSRPAAKRAVERVVAWKSLASPKPTAAKKRVTTAAKIRKSTKPPATAIRTVSATRTQPAPSRARPATRPAHPLGPTYIDETNGFAIRLPANWSLRSRRAGGPWLLECGDTRRGLISVGVACAATAPRDGASGKLLARGSAVIAGKKATWSKSTSPLRAGTTSPAVTHVNYLLPLDGGRFIEIRLAAAPEEFDNAATVMKQSVATLRLAAPSRRPAPAVASTD